MISKCAARLARKSDMRGGYFGIRALTTRRPALRSHQLVWSTQKLLKSPIDSRSSCSVLRFFSSPARSSYAHTDSEPLLEDAVVQISSERNGVLVDVGFEESFFPASWLWSNDPATIHPSSGQRTRSPSTFFGWRVVSAEVVQASSSHGHRPPLGSLHPVGGVYEGTLDDAKDRNILCLTWELGGSSFVSHYDLGWLWSCRTNEATSEMRREGTVVRWNNAINRSTSLFRIDYEEVLTNEDALFHLVQAVVDDGAVIVQGTPSLTADANASVAHIARAMAGGMSHGQLYGDIFHVKSMENAINIAYTSAALPPHQDLTYYESPPGMQFLHCVSNKGIIGGESVLVDALAAAEEFRRICPDLFEVLVRVEATFLKQREGADMVYRRPHIQVDSFGDVISVRWAPPFHGPLAASPDVADDYFVAHAAFERMLDNSLADNRLLLPLAPGVERQLADYAKTATWFQRLEPGEMLVFNNLRLVHGRRGFDIADKTKDSVRQLTGCYCNLDDTLSRYRVLRRNRIRSDHGSLYVRRSGNGSTGTI